VAERLRETIGTPMFPLWKTRHERFVAMAKSQLDPADFAANWQEGRTMELEEAVKWALMEGRV
jgi:hypothetical protein